MKLDFDALAAYLQKKTLAFPGRQFWLGIAGAPGSGKSTLCRELLERLGSCAVVIPMDGYHYYRRELDRMPDPTEAHRRRGAPFTFNTEKFVADLEQTRKTGFGKFASFDHGQGDPVEGTIAMLASHQIVLIEGNYLLLDDTPWQRLRGVFDETWYLDVDIVVCKARVQQRFLDTGRDEATARFRVEYNDGPNAELVARESPPHATHIITE